MKEQKGTREEEPLHMVGNAKLGNVAELFKSLGADLQKLYIGDNKKKVKKGKKIV